MLLLALIPTIIKLIMDVCLVAYKIQMQFLVLMIILTALINQLDVQRDIIYQQFLQLHVLLVEIIVPDVI